MKTPYTLALAGLGLLVFACQHNPDPVVPVSPHDWIAPPASSTVAIPSLPVTDVASLTSITPSVLTVANCRIVKETLKEAFDAPATFSLRYSRDKLGLSGAYKREYDSFGKPRLETSQLCSGCWY